MVRVWRCCLCWRSVKRRRPVRPGERRLDEGARLFGRAGAQVKPDPGVGIVRSDHGNARILRRVLDLVDIGTVSQRLFGHVLRSRVVCDVPVSGTQGSVAAVDRFVDFCGSRDEMPATAGNAGRIAIVATRDAAVEKIIGHHERPGIAEPATCHTAPWCVLIRAITDAPVKSAAVVALKKSEA